MRVKRVGAPDDASGFSMMEVMVVVAILGIVLAVAIPNFTSLINSNRLSAAANEFVASFQEARSEAIRLNRQVSLCRTADGSSCASGTNWTQWIVVSSDGTVLRTGNVRSQLKMSANPALGDKLTFSPGGFASTSAGLASGTVNICMVTTKPTENVRSIAIVGGSQARIESKSGAGACAAPGDPS